MHITEEFPKEFISKKGTLASSEIVSVPSLITKEELEERQVLYSKSKEEKKKLKKAKINIDKNLAALNLINYSKSNDLGNALGGNVSIYFK